MAKDKIIRVLAKVRVASTLHGKTFEAGQVIEYPAGMMKELKPLLDRGILEMAKEVEEQDASKG